MVTPNEAAILASVLGGLAGAAVGSVTAIFTTRYLMRKSPNYSEQISSVNQTLDSRIAAVKETLSDEISGVSSRLLDLAEMQHQHFTKAQQFREREFSHTLAQAWKPTSRIEVTENGGAIENWLVLKSPEAFTLIAVYMQTKDGATLMDIPITTGQNSTGFRVFLSHQSMLKVKQSEGKGGLQHGARGQVAFKLSRGEHIHVGVVPFTTEDVSLNSTIYIKLLG